MSTIEEKEERSEREGSYSVYSLITTDWITDQPNRYGWEQVDIFTLG